MSKTTNPTSDDELTFEQAMAELDELVSRMEDGELSLDDSLKAFERGVMLTRKCQEALSQAELRVKTLTDADTLEELEFRERMTDLFAGIRGDIADALDALLPTHSDIAQPMVDAMRHAVFGGGKRIASADGLRCLRSV